MTVQTSSYDITVHGLTSQHAPSGRAVYSHLLCECTVLLPVQRLGHDICDLFFSWDVLQFEFSLFNLVVNEVMSDFNMFGLVVELGILGNCNGRLVVHEQDSGIIVG